MSLEKLLFTHKPLAAQNDCAPAESYQNLIRRGGQNPKTVGIPTLFGFSDLFPLAPAQSILNRFVYEV